MTTKSTDNPYRNLPSVDKLIRDNRMNDLCIQYGRELIVHIVRKTLNEIRSSMDNSGIIINESEIIDMSISGVRNIAEFSLKQIINATGIVLHTNIGRAPMGHRILKDITPIITGYSNLEFDIETAARGHRISHIKELLTFLTGAEDVLVVNNNAAGIILTLNTLSLSRDVIISRGELIEIGGAFRIPEIMAASGANMVEIGTTNRTRLSDYESALKPDTGLLFKAHRSNYTITGFTEEVSVKNMAMLARKWDVPFVYDIGSGLLRKPNIPGLESEPDVRGSIENGADLVLFSGDKLLGGPQAGIIAGRKDLITKLAKAPLMRALRVGKLTLASLASACRNYLSDEKLKEGNPLYALLERTQEERKNLAIQINEALHSRGIESQLTDSIGQVGGGTLPDLKLPSFAIMLVPQGNNTKTREKFSEQIFHKLLKRDMPVLSVLREGKVYFDTFAIFDTDSEEIITAVAECISSL